MDNNIIIKITSEADLSDAQVQMRDMVDKSKQLEEQMRNLTKAEDEDLKAMRERVKLGKEDASILDEVTATYREKRKEIQSTINATKKNIAAISSEIKAYDKAQKGGKRMAMQLREIRDQLQKLEDAGDSTSEEFVNLAVQAARLQDQIGDTQQRISILASDTLALDAAMSAGSGLTGAFNTATSAMALFGGESEDLEKAFYKVQAAMSALNGIQEIANALNKDSAINVAISTKLHSLQAVALAKEAVAAGTATKAQKLLNAVMKLNPFGLILTAITAVIALFTVFSGDLEDIGRKIRTFFDGIAGFFSKTYAANRKAQLSLEEYERTQTRVNMRMNYLNAKHAESLHAIEEAESAANTAAKKRHASSVEMAELEIKYLKQRRSETEKYVNEAITANNLAVEKAKQAVLDQKNALKMANGQSKVTEETEKLEQAQKTYLDLVQQGIDLDNQRNQARQAVLDAEQNLANERIAIRRQTQQAIIDAMADGLDKEIQQLHLSYEQQLQEAGKSGELRKALEIKMAKEEADIRKRYADEKTSEYVEQLRIESEQDQFNLDKKIAYYQADMAAKISALDKNKMSEQAYVNAVDEIYAEHAKNINAVNEQIAADLTSSLQREVNKAQDEAEMAQGSERISASERYFEAQMALYDQQQSEIELLRANDTISYQEYSDRLYEIEKNRVDAEIELQQSKMQVISESFNMAIERVQDIASVVFDAISVSIQKQMDDLDEYYTTDAVEAAKNAKKKYLTEEQYAKKKAELELKQQRLNKANAIFEIALNTASAIMGFLANPGGIPGIALAAVAGTMGAAQLAVAAAKPLPQYAKGRKGGAAEMAIVGERGPELMYVPDGASIIPNNKIQKPETWGQFGVPELPSGTLKYASASGLSIDYERLGEAVAKSMPKQQSVVVNVDKNGVTVARGNSRRTYLNTKYAGQWN